MNFSDYLVVVNIEKVDDVVSEGFGAVGEASDVREKHYEILLVAFKANLVLVVSLCDNIF